MSLKRSLNVKFLNFLLIFGFILVLCLLQCPATQAGDSDDEASSSDELPKLTKRTKKLKVSHPVTLTRISSNNSRLVNYTQQLIVQGQEINFDRPSTRERIQYVSTASTNDNSMTHLLAQRVCMGTKKTWVRPITTALGFPHVPETPRKNMEWVSRDSKAKSNNDYYIRAPQKNCWGRDYWGGHAEPQLIDDLEAAIIKDHDKVIKCFLPHPNNTQDIYMCGLEIFGPYDMCDEHNGEGNNKYNCVGKLKQFRKKHQQGNESISKYIRDKLEDRFKGKPEDAFVVIYHAEFPYNNVHSYNAEDEEDYYPLKFKFAGCQFSRDAKMDNTFELSQNKSVDIEPKMLYGYIHHLADKKAKYDSSLNFSFH